MTLLRILSTATLALGLGTAANADQFHFSKPDAPTLEARILAGVLLEETELDYVIRVEGGEITVPKSLVQKIEKDGLTVAQIEGRENDARVRLAQADRSRREAQAAEASVRESLRGAANAVEASATRDGESETELNEPLLGYDPVLHRVGAVESVVEDEIRRGLGGEIRRQVQRELRSVRRGLRQAWRRSR